MTRGAARGAATAALAALLALAAPLARAASPRQGPPIASVTALGAGVERSDGGPWRGVDDAASLRVGDRLRVGASALARVSFPWMTMTASPGSAVSLPRRLVLTTVLEDGRTEQASVAGGFVKIETREAQVRGTGVIVVRRDGERTSVMVRSGEARVETPKGTVALAAGQGTVAVRGQPPLPAAALARGPAVQGSSRDAVYVRLGEPVTVSWQPRAAAVVLELRALDTDAVLVQRRASGVAATLELPWLGTYRWRVLASDERGLESLPSGEALLCAVER